MPTVPPWAVTQGGTPPSGWNEFSRFGHYKGKPLIDTIGLIGVSDVTESLMTLH